MFPDEYHLYTLDQMLSAISRLNPHVDMKKIVIGLMDRLSTYAQREAEATSAENKQEAEESAVSQLLEKVKLSDALDPKAAEAIPATTNGQGVDESTTSNVADETKVTQPESVTVNGTDASKSNKPGIGEVLLFEIFYDQVINLVKTRTLPIQDTMALLTSLVNLAL